MPTSVLHGWRPGLLGDIVRLHAVEYAREWTFGPRFEIVLAERMAALFARNDTERDRVFHVDGADGHLLGTLTIDGSDPALAKGHVTLRAFVVAGSARGQGLGTALMTEAMAFLDARGTTRCTLSTFAGLDAARRLYESVGFQLVAEAETGVYGTPVMGQTFAWER